ncbi:MAG: GNAT family N-acetyltransferase [Flavobacteriales bacterium]|nr:GNAT family N-acetyltransferase [Flavobacteriales bacterium]
MKSNLIGFTFPPEPRPAAHQEDVIAGMQMEREAGTLQIEYVYTMPDHRGHGLAGRAIERHVLHSITAGVRKAQVQVFTNNKSAIKAYERAGFAAVRSFRSPHPDVLRYLPWNEKLLMERTIIS